MGSVGSIQLILNGGLKEKRKKTNSLNDQIKGFERKKCTDLNQQSRNIYGAKQGKVVQSSTSYAEILKNNCIISKKQSSRLVQRRVADK